MAVQGVGAIESPKLEWNQWLQTAPWPANEIFCLAALEPPIFID